MTQFAPEQKAAREKAVSQCSLTIIEAAMVWEMLLVGYQQLSETEKLRKCSEEPALKEFAGTRLEMLAGQVKDAEILMIRAGMPLPAKKQTVGRLLLVHDDIQMIRRMFFSCQKRIKGFIFIIGSMVTNSPLRLVVTEFLKEELNQLENLCYCTVKTVSRKNT